MKKLLWVGDAGVPSGFARATHKILDTLLRSYDVTVLGVNYRGDPHSYPYPIYAAAAGGDVFGVGRLVWVCDAVKPDVIVIQNDGWNIPLYVNQLRVRLSNGQHAFPEYAKIPVVAIVAVDGKNFRGRWLDGVAYAIFWTQFALDEARAGGYEGDASVVPLGVDLTEYYPADQQEARQRRFSGALEDGAFIVGNVNRNQPRKRWDLTVKYFAEWVKGRDVKDAYLYLHTAPTGDLGCDVKQLMQYYGLLPRLILMEPAMWYGVPEAQMRDTYNTFDVQVTTTQGEGFGLTTFEGMACGVPQIVPAWASLGELPGKAVLKVPCTSTAIGPPYVNVVGGVPDEVSFIDALDLCYRDLPMRKRLSFAGLKLVEDDRYRWPEVGRRYADILEGLLSLVPEVISEKVWQDLGRPEEASA